MKKLLSTLLLAAAVPATMLAKPMSMESLSQSQLKVTPDIKSTFLKADIKINPAMLADKEGQTVMFDTIPTHGWWGMYSATGFMNPDGLIQYDENTDAVYVLHNRFTLKLDLEDPEDETRGVLRAMTYKNGGTVEGPSVEIFNQAEKLLWAPTFDFVNLNKETDPSKVNFMAFSSLSRGFTAGGTLFINSDPAFCLYDPAKIVDGAAKKETFYQVGPGDNANYPWDDLVPYGFVGADQNARYIAGAPLSAKEGSGLPDGIYGMIIAENTEENGMEFSSFPPEFAQSKFDDPKPGYYVYSPVYYGKDKDNKLYAFINNNHRAVSLTKRLPAITVSNNNGFSWGEFDVMPWSVFNDYVKDRIEGNILEDLEFGFNAFAGSCDFLMQENGDFSYVSKLFVQDKNTNALYVYEIVEVYKENGQWGIRKVEDMLYLNKEGKRTFELLRTIYEGGVEPVDGKLIYASYPRSNELELAITKDRKHIVIKWIDYKNARDASGKKVYVDADTTQVVNLQYQNSETKQWTEEVIQEYMPTAIYVKNREIGKDTWSETVQLTNDNRYYLHTHMPDMVPSLERIPILSSLTSEVYPSTLTSIVTTMPKLYREMAYNDLKYTQYAVYNATGTLAVNDTKTSKDAISVYPNPAGYDFTVSCEANATVEVFNTLGEKMMDVKGNTANTSSLANGIYLVKVTKDGKVTSTLFTVAK